MKFAVLAVFMFSLFLQATCYANRDEGLEPAEYFFLPKGDAVQGKKSFEEMKCTACHQTADQTNEKGHVAARKGPVLNATQAEYPAGWIANSIVSPSHTITLDSEGLSEGGDLSRMPDFTNVMTVRQLIDIVAYIKSQGDLSS